MINAGSAKNNTKIYRESELYETGLKNQLEVIYKLIEDASKQGYKRICVYIDIRYASNICDDLQNCNFLVDITDNKNSCDSKFIISWY